MKNLLTVVTGVALMITGCLIEGTPSTKTYEEIVDEVKAAWPRFGIIESCNRYSPVKLCEETETHVRIPFEWYEASTGNCEILSVVLPRTIGSEYLTTPGVMDTFSRVNADLHFSMNADACGLDEPN